MNDAAHRPTMPSRGGHGGARAGLQVAAVVLAAAAVTGCADEADPDGLCGGQPCLVPQTRDDLLDALGGFGDPVAEYLRAEVNADGSLPGDWAQTLAGVGDVLGCDAGRKRTFVVLSNLELRPKGILAPCADDPTEASRLFMVLEPDPESLDLDAQRFRMASWDPDVARYRRYQVVPDDEAMGLRVAPDPSFCEACHGRLDPAGGQLGEWVPLMNEMTNPWAQWNADPGFESFLFDDFVPDGTDAGPVFAAAVADGIESAANLEPIIRAGIDRYIGARVARRTEPADLDLAVEMLRPLFCDESLNYVSEVHQSGELRSSAIVDLAIGDLMRAVVPDGPWPFLGETTVRLAVPSASESPLALMPVRGETTLQAEAALVSRQVLTAMQVLRVRALDWSSPVLSTMRCDLFVAGRERIEAGALDPAGYATTAELLTAAYDEVMGPVATGSPDTLVAFADAEDPAAAAAWASGDLASLTVAVTAFGDSVQAHLDAQAEPGARGRLHDLRIERGCAARRSLTTAPLIPDTDDCD